MTILVCIDRDGTVNEDGKNYYLGSSPNWKAQVEFLPGVVEGIRRLNGVDDLSVFIVTNQSGVSLKGGDFDNLNLGRMHEVNRYILGRLASEGALVDGYFACPWVDWAYVQKSMDRGRRVDLDYVFRCPDMKPGIGMIEKAAAALKVRVNKCDVYTIGDRFSDVQMGLNAGGGLGFWSQVLRLLRRMLKG